MKKNKQLKEYNKLVEQAFTVIGHIETRSAFYYHNKDNFVNARVDIIEISALKAKASFLIDELGSKKLTNKTNYIFALNQTNSLADSLLDYLFKNLPKEEIIDAV